EARATRHGPAFHHAVELESQVIMQASCGVLLDDIAVARMLGLVAARFGRDIKLPLLAINLERHINLRASFASIWILRRCLNVVMSLEENSTPAAFKMGKRHPI